MSNADNSFFSNLRSLLFWNFFHPSPCNSAGGGIFPSRAFENALFITRQLNGFKKIEIEKQKRNRKMKTLNPITVITIALALSLWAMPSATLLAEGEPTAPQAPQQPAIPQVPVPPAPQPPATQPLPPPVGQLLPPTQPPGPLQPVQPPQQGPITWNSSGTNHEGTVIFPEPASFRNQNPYLRYTTEYVLEEIRILSSSYLVLLWEVERLSRVENPDLSTAFNVFMDLETDLKNLLRYLPDNVTTISPDDPESIRAIKEAVLWILTIQKRLMFRFYPRPEGLRADDTVIV